MFGKKPITLKFYTADKDAYAYAKPNFGNKFMPNWWKKLEAPDSETETVANIKFCVGMTSYYKRGIIIPMWCDLTVDVSPEKELNYMFYDERSKMEFHSVAQRGSFADPENFIHGKIRSAWNIVCDEDVEFHFNTPIWSFQNPNTFRTLPAVINYKHQFNTHINLLFDIPTGETQRVYIHKDTPIAIIHPLSERKVKIEHYLITEDEFKTKFPRYNTATLMYHKRKKLMEKQESKCPFGFGGNK